jgi:murein L,D-transpeptidase YafK
LFHRFRTVRWTVTLSLLAVLLSPTAQAEDPGRVWLLVDGDRRELRVMRAEDTLAVYPGIAVGRSGIGDKARRGDDVTPVGRYRIAYLKPESRFRRFYGFDYPGRHDARRALDDGRIDQPTFDQIIAAHDRGEMPPQHTPLGGFVGIHGLGSGSPEVHKRFNWTRGCVALTNEQIDDLAGWVGEGTVVVVR